MREQNKYKRRQYIVDKGIQYRFVCIVLLYLLIFFLITLLVVFFAGWEQLIIKLSNVYPQAMLVVILNNVYFRLYAGFLFILPIAVISAIVVSHKIAGPLVRIKWALRQLAGGNFNIFIKLRKNDQLEDVAKLINNLAQSLKKKNVR